MEIIIVLLLIIVNGVFAMAEIAIISSRKSKLQQLSNDGDKGAKVALEITDSPSRFLSTVQIGITLVGIFAGAFGGATISRGLARYFNSIPFFAPYSDVLSLTLVVAAITYLSLVVGELVPKRIGLSNPEKIAKIVSRPMNKLSFITSPLVWVLSASTDGLMKLLHIRDNSDPEVTDEEVRVLLREGAETGAFEVEEKDIMERTLRLGDKKVNVLMTPRKEVIWLDIDSSMKILRSKIKKYPHSIFPVCRGDLDRVVGVVRTKEMLLKFLPDEKISLKEYLHKPLFVPESMDGLKVLELFKKTGIHLAIVVDEYGSTQGVLTLTDILEEIVGDIPDIDEDTEREIVKREDGTFLVDGLVPIDEFKEYFKIKKLTGERSGIYHTVGGLVTYKIGHIPLSGDNFEMGKFHFEVMDMDGNRVDKVLVSPAQQKLL